MDSNKFTKDQKGIKYILLCSCGNTGLSESSPLVKGKSKSCGCLHKEIMGALKRTHGKSGTRTYKTWEMMVQRCTNINYDGYPDYGGKGVQVCESWLESFEAFYFDMGDRPVKTSLNRKINGETGSPYTIYSKILVNGRIIQHKHLIKIYTLITLLAELVYHCARRQAVGGLTSQKRA